MSIIRVSELDPISIITSGSLFLTSYGDNNPRTSKYITAENLLNQSSIRHHAAYYSDQTQTFTGGTEQIMTFNNTTTEFGISLVDSTKLKVSAPGIYNLQFSAQVYRIAGGTKESIFIWFKKNGQVIPASNTDLSFANNGVFQVAAWNLIEVMNTNDYLEIAWGTTDTNIEITSVTSPTYGPAIPSIIVTLTQA
jgi:hypothetical protein